MKQSNRLLLTLSLLISAMICYGIGLSTSFMALIIVGAIFELAFWFRIIRSEN